MDKKALYRKYRIHRNLKICGIRIFSRQKRVEISTQSYSNVPERVCAWMVELMTDYKYSVEFVIE